MAKRSSTKKKTGSGKKKAAKTKGVKKAAKKTSAAKKSGKRAAGKTPASKGTAAIAADSAEYPRYILTFEGSLIVDPPQVVRGTHTFFGTFGNSKAKFSISHNDTDDVPNLTVLVEPEE